MDNGHDTGQANGQPAGIPISEAADRLGLSVAATRKRVKRGTLEAYKAEDGTWQVIIPETVEDESHDSLTPSDELVEILKDEVRFLREELGRRTDELKAERESRSEAEHRRDMLFAQFGSQLKAISETTSEVHDVLTEPLPEEPDKPPVSWWRRVLLGEQ